MAQKWGQYDHVIFELYNEPKETSWGVIKDYADKVVSAIRQHSDNLILVGNRKYDQNPQEAINNEVTGENIAYTFHYYANSHCWEGQTSWGDPCEGANAQQAINAGLSVFVSEWGTADANGGGNPDTGRNTSWQNWMDQNKLSWANWSASKVEEGTAAFSSGSNRNSLQYTTSGQMVKEYLSTNPTTYTRCATAPIPEPNPEEAIHGLHSANFDVTFSGKALNVSGATANVEIFTAKGDKLMDINNVQGELSLAAFPAGKYLVRVKSGSVSKMKAISIK